MAVELLWTAEAEAGFEGEFAQLKAAYTSSLRRSLSPHTLVAYGCCGLLRRRQALKASSRTLVAKLLVYAALSY
jgi:hypothetical protein